MITDINSEDHLVQQTFAAHLEKVLVRRLRRCLSIPSPLLWGPKPTGGSSRDLSAATPPVQIEEMGSCKIEICF